MLYLLMGDVELLVTCSSLTSPPSKDGGQVAQNPQSPVLPQLPNMPVGAAPTQPLIPTAVTLSPQKLQMPSGLAHAEGNPFSKFPYMPAQLPHLPQYPGQYSTDDMSAAVAQLYMMQQLPQYPYQLPGLPPFSMLPGLFQPTAPPTPPATTTPAPPVKHDGIPPPPQLQQFPVFPHHYPFLPFRGPLPPEGHAGASPMLKPLHPPMFHIPMLPNPPTTATPTTRVPPTIKYSPQRPFFNPYPYLPYYVPQQAFLPQFPEKPGLPQQHGQQPVNHVPPQFYPSGY